MSANQDQQVICSFCQFEYLLSKAVEMVDRETTVQEFFVRCPNCKKKLHLFFMTPELHRARKELEAQQRRISKFGIIPSTSLDYSRQRYAKLFANINEALRTKYRVMNRATLQKEMP